MASHLSGHGPRGDLQWRVLPGSEFSGLYTGFYLIENLNGNFGGKNQMYRFYVNDPVRFKKSIRVTIEHGHANNFENDYTSTAFWYQKEPHKAFPADAQRQERLPGAGRRAYRRPWKKN